MLELNIGTRIIKTERPAFVMGILNVTDDSFYENSRGGVEKALKLIDAGADIIDIGGESTRPGFTPVDPVLEKEKIGLVVRAIRQISDIPISIDTRKAVVMEMGVMCGADLLNDVSALEDDPVRMAMVCRNFNCGVILMHGGSVSKPFCWKEGQKEDITRSVVKYLKQRIKYCVENGIPEERIILDPGIGFGKSFELDVQLINEVGKVAKAGYPVVMGLSRKRCIGAMTGKEVQDRLYGTLAANLLAVKNGASILRVHDVAETIDALNVMKYLK